MTYAFTQDIPITPDLYQRIRSTIAEDQPPGLILHMAAAIDEGRSVRYFDVWESEDDYNRFLNERLRPLMDGVYKSTNYEPAIDQPPRKQMDVLDVWQGKPWPFAPGKTPGSQTSR